MLQDWAIGLGMVSNVTWLGTTAKIWSLVTVGPQIEVTLKYWSIDEGKPFVATVNRWPFSEPELRDIPLPMDKVVVVRMAG
jgi:hypothetical protein